MDHSFYSELAVDPGRVLTTGPKANAMLDALEEPWTGDDPTPATPTLDHDPLLSSARGRWRMPLTLQRADFERTFAMKERRVVTAEEVLADLRAEKFATPAAMARYYGKRHNWTGSLMWFCIREKLVNNTGEWGTLFPKRPAAKKQRQSKATQRSNAPATQGSASLTAQERLTQPFSLPPLDGEEE